MGRQEASDGVGSRSLLKPCGRLRAHPWKCSDRSNALLPLHKVAKDPVRQALDEQIARDVLGLVALIFVSGGPLALLCMKRAQEPSIRGHKGSTGHDTLSIVAAKALGQRSALPITLLRRRQPSVFFEVI